MEKSLNYRFVSVHIALVDVLYQPDFKWVGMLGSEQNRSKKSIGTDSELSPQIQAANKDLI